MFEHFTFGAMPQSRHHLDDDAYPSPKDTTTLTPPPTSFPFPSNSAQSGINDLVAKLSQQTLQQQSRDELVKRFQALKDDSPPGLEIDDEDMDPRTETVSVPPTPTFTNVSCRRLQRQLNVQMQSCDSHVRDINALVEDMISSNSQCRITSRPWSTLPPPSTVREEGNSAGAETSGFDEPIVPDDVDIDEGFCEGEDPDPEKELEMTLRMASAPGVIRKQHLRYTRSVDAVNIGGQIKVRSVPRMRRRPTHVSRTK